MEIKRRRLAHVQPRKPSRIHGLAEIPSATLSCKVPFLIQIGASVVRKTDINDGLERFAWWTLAIIVFGLVLAIRIRLLGIPLERDEGEIGRAHV